MRDHGDGLTPEALERAFDRFWQADPARAGSGTGLGLSIVAAVPEEHRGSVWATNAPDGGAVFTISIPLAAPSATTGAFTGATPDAPTDVAQSDPPAPPALPEAPRPGGGGIVGTE